MKRCFVFFLLVAIVEGQENCSTPTDLCSPGISLPTFSGSCSDRFILCDDGDDSTESTCFNSFCQHQTVIADAPKCTPDCLPECEEKECGENGCGGFCGTCGESFGCYNYTCVQGAKSGNCDSPFNLGNTDQETVIDTDTRLTLFSIGDTSDAIHFETPSCNTLTASPELLFSSLRFLLVGRMGKQCQDSCRC
jgi:hypothetical protein